MTWQKIGRPVATENPCGFKDLNLQFKYTWHEGGQSPIKYRKLFVCKSYIGLCTLYILIRVQNEHGKWYWEVVWEN